MHKISKDAKHILKAFFAFCPMIPTENYYQIHSYHHEICFSSWWAYLKIDYRKSDKKSYSQISAQNPKNSLRWQN